MFNQLVQKIFNESPNDYKEFTEGLGFITKLLSEDEHEVDQMYKYNPFMMFEFGINFGVVDKSDITPQDIKNAIEWVENGHFVKDYEREYKVNQHTYECQISVIKIMWHFETGGTTPAFKEFGTVVYLFYKYLRNYRSFSEVDKDIHFRIYHTGGWMTDEMDTAISNYYETHHNDGWMHYLRENYEKRHGKNSFDPELTGIIPDRFNAFSDHIDVDTILKNEVSLYTSSGLRLPPRLYRFRALYMLSPDAWLPEFIKTGTTNMFRMVHRNN